MKMLLFGQLAVLSVLSVPPQSQEEVSDPPEQAVQHVVLAEDVAWQPCPPGLPAGCEIAVLEGNPRDAGFFTVRFRLTDTFIMPPHTHPRDERVTVLEGRVAVGFGVDGLRENARQFGPGDYYVNFKGAVHTVWGNEMAEIQITGLGPWEVQFIEQRNPD